MRGSEDDEGRRSVDAARSASAMPVCDAPASRVRRRIGVWPLLGIALALAALAWFTGRPGWLALAAMAALTALFWGVVARLGAKGGTETSCGC